ncbi:MAG TPA: helix-turn-helix transcriptional regulator [Micropepsaceae bacterium]|nr:helix-turn-helix transcriptional regulator [Micropepsaceae bacterium]
MAGENRLHRSDAVTQDQIYRVIDRIYEAALDPNLWTDLLRDIGKLIGAPQGSLGVGSQSQKTFTDFGFGRNEEAIALYNTEFRGEDPWFEPLARLDAGTVATGQQLYPTPNFANTEYYHHCLVPDEVYDCLGVILEKGRDLNAFVAFQRPAFLPLFGDTEKRLLQLLVPHLQRIIALHRRFESLSAMSVLQCEMLDRLSFGVVLVGSPGGIYFINAVARAIAAEHDGLRFCASGVAAASVSDNDAVTTAQKRALAGAVPEAAGAVGSTIAIRRPSMKRPYIVQIMPVGARIAGENPFLGNRTRFALVVITDPENAAVPTLDLLIQAYRLTPAEAALALKIGAGVSLKDAAEAFSISEETARWHLKRVLAKTETARQSQLVSLLLAMRSPFRAGHQVHS